MKLHLIGGERTVDELIQILPSLKSRSVPALATCVAESLSIKAPFVTSDEFDTGVRRRLNVGHCFGHAVGSARSFRMPHGRAVLVGMSVANALSEHRGILSSARRIF